MTKKYKAVQEYVGMSPRKLRLVAGMVREVTPKQAVEMLPYVRQRAAEPLLKVIKSVVANAKNGGASEEKLVFSEIQIGEASRLKRGRPVSRGQWHPVVKRMSHIRVVVAEKQEVSASDKKVAKVAKKKGNKMEVKK